MLYFPLAGERNKWKMFSHTPLGPGAWGLGPRVRFGSHAQCSLSVAFCCLPLLTYISEFFGVLLPIQPLFFVRYHDC